MRRIFQATWKQPNKRDKRVVKEEVKMNEQKTKNNKPNKQDS